MPLVEIDTDISPNLILGIRLITGFVWLGTVFRRLFLPNFDNFEGRISQMAQGDPLFPEFFMEFAVEYWYLFFAIIVTIEFISAISLLLGVFARGGALLATINGFAIGMAGIGLGIVDLIIPWSVAFGTLFLLLFTHPGRYKGMDGELYQKDIPRFLLILT